MHANKIIGSRTEVMHGTAKKTSGGLTKSQLKYNKQGKIVSKKASALAKKNNHLNKTRYIIKKGGSRKLSRALSANHIKSRTSKSRTSKSRTSKSRTSKSRKVMSAPSLHRINSISKIYALMHGCNMEEFKTYIKEQYMYPDPGSLKMVRGNEVQMNEGIFTLGLFKCNIKKPLNQNLQTSSGSCYSKINLILDNALLEDRYDYHLSTNWAGGLKLNKPEHGVQYYTKNNITTFTNNLEEQKCGRKNSRQLSSCCDEAFIKNEIVFKKKINLRKYLKEIWICSNINGDTSFKLKELTSHGNTFSFPVQSFIPNQIKVAVEQLLNEYNFESIPVKLITKQDPL